jgi:hypothetical protein
VIKLADLRGLEVSAVSFVRDHAEVWIEDVVVRLLEPPGIEKDGTSIRFPEPGSRDRLCALIGTFSPDRC